MCVSIDNNDNMIMITISQASSENFNTTKVREGGREGGRERIVFGCGDKKHHKVTIIESFLV